MFEARERPYERAERAAVVALAVGMGVVTLAIAAALRVVEQEGRRARELRHKRRNVER
jgi:hypothetical protein